MRSTGRGGGPMRMAICAPAASVAESTRPPTAAKSNFFMSCSFRGLTSCCVVGHGIPGRCCVGFLRFFRGGKSCGRELLRLWTLLRGARLDC